VSRAATIDSTDAMTTATEILPLIESRSPSDQQALAAAVADAYQGGTPLYSIGGGTSLEFGTPPTRPGIGVSLGALDRVIDYPARDMTITVEAGITIDALTSRLAGERQWLPIDAPHRDSATLGGLVATAWSGPRRYGYGTPRDYVIGVSAVDGRGTPFKGGGRVVKNVAGYDFCKLLTGSLGTLAIISQVTLKIRPLPECSQFLACDLHDLATAERLLTALVNSQTTPAAIELLAGPQWRDHASLGLMTAGTVVRLAVGLEGTAAEVGWMVDQLSAEWRELGVTTARLIEGDAATALWRDLTHFSAAPDAPLVVKASVSPDHTTQFVELVHTLDPQASVQAHAGNGIVIARFSSFEAGDVSRVLVGRLRPAACRGGGSLVVLSSTLGGLTRQAIWGSAGDAAAWMGAVKCQFDPKNLLNPGRFVYGNE
jgi:glycolate oxidase FAD binding subunit